MFNIIKEQNMDTVLNLENGSEVVPTSELTAIRTYCPILNHVTQKPVKYVMRHKVKKTRYRITTSSGKQVIVTGDHSCMVLRYGKLTAVKANEIDPKTDKMITDNHYKPTVTEESNEG
jgi:intein/homing endonuclease